MQPQFTIQEVRDWRVRRFGEGLPSTVRDFCQVHDICVVCLGRGEVVNDEWIANPLGIDIRSHKLCPTCVGSGKYVSPIEDSWMLLATQMAATLEAVTAYLADHHTEAGRRLVRIVQADLEAFARAKARHNGLSEKCK